MRFDKRMKDLLPGRFRYWNAIQYYGLEKAYCLYERNYCRRHYKRVSRVRLQRWFCLKHGIKLRGSVFDRNAFPDAV